VDGGAIVLGGKNCAWDEFLSANVSLETNRIPLWDRRTAATQSASNGVAGLGMIFRSRTMISQFSIYYSKY
jgi:hypothetical protein